MSDSSLSGVSAVLTGAGTFQVRLDFGSGPLIADEPFTVGGLGSGPSPYELLSAGLAACTAMTLNLYAGRKGWDLAGLEIEVAHARAGGADRFTRQIRFGAGLDDEQRARLLDIADRCPVHRTLDGGAEIVTVVAERIDSSLGAEPAAQHAEDMRETCATED